MGSGSAWGGGAWGEACQGSAAGWASHAIPPPDLQESRTHRGAAGSIVPRSGQGSRGGGGGLSNHGGRGLHLEATGGAQSQLRFSSASPSPREPLQAGPHHPRAAAAAAVTGVTHGQVGPSLAMCATPTPPPGRLEPGLFSQDLSFAIFITQQVARRVRGSVRERVCVRVSGCKRLSHISVMSPWLAGVAGPAR